MAREIRAGRECQLRNSVPTAKITRRVVIIWINGRARRVHTGVTRRMRKNKEVRAGLVVADVGVLCVDKKSVNCSRGSRSTLHLDVNTFNVSTISSRLFWCLIEPSEISLLCPGSLSPVNPVEDSGEYRREYIPSIKPTTTTTGPAQRIAASPYSVRAQKPAMRRKLSHGSLLVHDSKPASLFRGRMNGWENANARVIWGGVATSRGDFWWTRMVDRCLTLEGWDGENVAIVGGFGSAPAGEWVDPLSEIRDGVEDIESSQGVSCSES